MGRRLRRRHVLTIGSRGRKMVQRHRVVRGRWGGRRGAGLWSCASDAADAIRLVEAARRRGLWGGTGQHAPLSDQRDRTTLRPGASRSHGSRRRCARRGSLAGTAARRSRPSNWRPWTLVSRHDVPHPKPATLSRDLEGDIATGRVPFGRNRCPMQHVAPWWRRDAA